MNAAAAAEVLTAEPTTSASTVLKPLMTFEQWANMDEDEPGEFVDGKLVEDEVTSILHEIIVSWLIRTLDNWASPRGYPVFGSALCHAPITIDDTITTFRRPPVTADDVPVGVRNATVRPDGAPASRRDH